MNKPIPAPSKILQKKWRDLNMESHYRRIHNVRPLVDDHVRQRVQVMTSNSRKQRMAEDRQFEIVKDNTMLVRRMEHILNKSSTRSILYTPSKNTSLSHRRRKLEQLTTDNLTMLSRLVNTKSEYDVKKLQSERRFHEKMLKHLCEFPYSLNKSGSTRGFKTLSEANSHNSQSTKAFRSKALKPLIPVADGEVLYSGTKALGETIYAIAILKARKKLKMVAQDTLKGDSYTLMLSRLEAMSLMRGPDNYVHLLDALMLENGELSLNDPRQTNIPPKKPRHATATAGLRPKAAEAPLIGVEVQEPERTDKVAIPEVVRNVSEKFVNYSPTAQSFEEPSPLSLDSRNASPLLNPPNEILVIDEGGSNQSSPSSVSSVSSLKGSVSSSEI